MENRKGFQFDFNKMLLMFAMIPLITTMLVVSVYNITNLNKELESGVYERLKACATGVKQYFEWDINEDILEIDEVSEEYIDSLQSQDIELTLFEKDTRWLTSVRKESGERNNGTTCDPAVWQTVSKGDTYLDNGIVIAGETYYGCYMPVYNTDGTVWGMAFAGEKEAVVTSAKNKALMITVIISVVVPAFFVVLAIFFAKIVVKPLNQVTQAIKATAEGNLNADTDIHSSLMETKELITSAKTLQSVLQDTVGKTKEIAESVLNSSEQVADLSGNCASSSYQITATVDGLSKAALNLADNVQNINMQVMDIGSNINDISESTEILSDSTNSIKESNEQAAEYISKVSESSSKSTEAVNNIHYQIEETHKAVEDIRNAVDLILSIAKQTNLLALNASIEAARAGEAGRGFAVVAGEIKELAEQSNQSAGEISNIASNIITKSEESVELSNQVTSLIEEEQSYIKETQTKFDILKQKVDDSVDQINSISEKMVLLDQAKNSITSSLADLSAISEENAASNEEVSASIEEISSSIQQIADNSAVNKEMAESLNDTIAYFK